MIRAHLVENPLYGLQVFLVDQNDDGKRILQVDDGEVFRWVELPPDGHPADERILRPTVVLPWDSGRALLEALVRHYQGAEDTRQLRKDYDAERKRVDDLSNALVDIARASAERGFRS